MVAFSRFQAQFPIRPGYARWIGLAMLALAVVACLLALAAFPQATSAPSGWMPYLASMVLFMAACYLLLPYQKAQTRPALPDRYVLAAGALILGLAAFMRFYLFDTLPFGTWWDEADIGMVAQRILNDPNYRPFYVATNDHPLHFFSLIALSFKLFGVGTEPIRLVTATFGLLTVVLAFLTGREAFGNRFGLVLAFCFAISRWHVTFSRFGVYSITLPFFELLTIWLLLRARRTAQIHDFAWAGLSLGLGVNFYIAVQLFVVVIGVYILLWIISALRSVPEKKTTPPRLALIGGLAAFVLAAWFALAPVVQYAVMHPDVYWGRSSQVSIFNQRDELDLTKALVSNTVKHIAMFNYRGDNNGRHNLPGEPMLDPLMGVLFVLGLALTLNRLRHPTHQLMLVLLVVSLLGGILTLDFEAPQSNRAFGSIVAALYFVALAVETLWRRFDGIRLTVRIRQILLAVTLLGVGGYVIYYNASTYFVRQANNDRVWLEYNGLETLTAYRMIEADPDDTSLYASVFLNNHLVIQFLAPQVDTSQTIIPPVGLPIRESGERPVAIFVDPENTWIVDEAKRFYPNATIRLDTTPGGAPALYTITLAPKDIQLLQGVTARYWLGGSINGEPTVTGNEKMLSVNWPADSPLAPPFVAQWESTLYVPQYGEYELILNSPAKSSMWLDEQPVLDGIGEQRVMLTLAQGDHTLRIQAASGDGPVSLQWRQPDPTGKVTGDPSLVPSSSLYLPAFVQVHGLLGTYYANETWSGPPAFIRIDPFLDMYMHIIPLPRPYTVEWAGQIDLPSDGPWTFGLRINGQAEVIIDGQTVVNAGGPTENIEGAITTTRGWHHIRVRFLDYLGGSRIHLYWTPPGGARQVVPSDALLPYP